MRDSWRRRIAGMGVWLLAGTAVLRAGGDEATAAPGDAALPAGAVLRLGSLRLRHAGGVRSARFTPDGDRLVSVGSDRRVRMFEASDGTEVWSAPIDPARPAPVAVAARPDGSVLVVTGDGAVLRFEVPAEEPAGVVETGLRWPVFSRDGALLAGRDREPNVLRVVDATGRDVARVEAEGGQVASFAFSPDGRWIAVAFWVPRSRRAGDTRVVVHPLAAQQRGEVTVDAGEVFCKALALAPGGRRALLCLSDGSVRTLHVDEAALGPPQKVFQGSTAQAAWSPDGAWAAVGGTLDRRIAVFEGATGDYLHGYRLHEQAVVALDFSPDGARLLSGGLDGRLVVSDPTTGEPILEPQGHVGAVRSVAWSPDGGTVVSGGFDGTVRIWDAATGDERKVARLPSGAVNRLAFSPDGERLACACQDGRVRLLDATTGEWAAEVQLADRAVLDLAWSPDGGLLAAGDASGKVRWLDGATARPLASVDVGPGFVFAVAWSPDGSRVVAGTSVLHLLDADAATEIRVLDGPHAPVVALAFASDGALLCAAADRRVSRWDLAAGRVETVVQEFPSRTSALAVRGDGVFAAASGLGETAVRVFDAKTGAAAARFEGHRQLVLALAFSPDGRRLVSASADSTLLVWALP